MPERIHNLGDRVRILYRALHPHAITDKPATAWFRRELSNLVELDVSWRTVCRWFNDGAPDEHKLSVEVAIGQLSLMASDEVGKQLELLRRVM